MPDERQTTPRRGFLARMIAGLAAAAAAPAAAPGLQAQESRPVSAKWDDRWTARITGRHRAVFDVPELKGGAVGLFRTGMWMDNCREMYGVPDSDLSAVLVVRHTAVPLFMNDAFWETYRYREQYADVLEDIPKGTGNPFRMQTFGQQEFGLEPLLTRGVTVLGCGVAFRQVVSHVMRQDGLPIAEAEARARDHLLPGVLLQPSGIFAVARAQELGCSYVWAI
ncbi:MAG TPA: hypothetical protein VLL51_08920 [Gemmatimonadales bacterium]|nr:hypothetical protein [Gemmatimonadales bacterium]